LQAQSRPASRARKPPKGGNRTYQHVRTGLGQPLAAPHCAGIVDATRGRMRPPPPPRRHPITAAVAAITAPIITATPVAITTSECATIDATALSRPLSPDALHGQAHLGTVTTASTVDFQGPPLLQPSPPSPPSSLPPSWPQPPALPSVATCAQGLLALPPPV